MTKERVVFDDLEIPDFKPRSAVAPTEPVDVRSIAERNGFTTHHTPTPAKPLLDARSLRRTNRTSKLNIATTEEARNRFWILAQRTGSTSGEEVLIRMMDAFERELDKSEC